ncbi:MAG TPA: hypothetical protein VK569_04570, partial [Bacteroidota bacterium]|nr:hypothetical protein [Bacteroidota bacterium]
MKRLEEDDRSRTGRADADRLKSKSPAPFPVPAAEAPAAGNKAATEQKILVIRERLQSALERGKSEKAAELFAELSKIIPDDPSMAEFRTRLQALQEEKARSREQARTVVMPAPPARQAARTPAAPPVPAPRSRTAEEDKAEKESRRRKIADMLEAANNYYQQEKYDKALAYIGEVLNLDPSHAKATSLRAQIMKARDLEEQIRMEEEERRAKDHATGTPVRRADPEAPAAPARSTDFWGSSLSQK